MAGAAAAGVEVGGSRFELEFVAGDGVGRRVALPACGNVRFEDGEPVRSFRWSKGQRHFPGWWWSSTTGRHVGHESWLERDHAMVLDFDPEVVRFASQPFWLCWHDADRERRHAPDFFARLADGTGVVIDVRPDDRIEARDAEAFTATGAACATVGWRYRRVGFMEAVFAENVRWLSRYRHPRCGREEVVARLLEVFTEPAGLFAAAARVGDTVAVLPALFHLMWCQELVADLASAPLSPATVVSRSGGGR